MPSARSRPLDRVWPWLLALALSLGAHLLLLLLPGPAIAPTVAETQPLQLQLSPATPQAPIAPASRQLKALAEARPQQHPEPAAYAPPSAAPRAHRAATPATAPLSVGNLLSQVGAGVGSEESAQPPSSAGTRLVYGSSARGYLWRQYMDDWVNKMERIGALNYPQEVRSQGLSGGPTLSVVINADGSLAALRVTISSHNATLDAAAEKIVRAAAPFAPFPPALAAQAQSLEIRRKWHFTTGNDLSVQ
ncbi:TonB family protein [Paludibacterium purpuratum]|nr:TonB family protein [Paludibacterium purpuratum]